MLSIPLLLSALTGCNLRDPSYALTPYKSCDALESAIKGQAEEEIRWAYAWGNGGSWSMGGGGFGATNDMALESAQMDGADAGGGDDRSYSETNTQVEDVDEADLIETDGTWIYVLAGDSLVITQAWPAEDIEQVARLDVEGSSQGMFLRDDGKLIVLSQLGWQEPDPLSGSQPEHLTSNGPIVKSTTIDVSDPTDPAVEREVYTQGTMYDARLVEDQLYLVSYSTLGVNQDTWYESKADALDAVEISTLADWMPDRFDNLRSGDAWLSAEEQVSDCTKVLGSARESGNYMVNVESLNVVDPDAEFVGTSVLGSLDAIYANGRSLYIVGSESADGPWQSFDSTIESIVHRFDIVADSGEVEYVSSGTVPGWVLNQFAMDEWDSHLRIATTAVDPDGGTTSAGVYVLEEDGDDLEVVGQVDELAEGEQIFAVRFEQDVGYVVTFEQIDPLFTFDLSDHEDPRAVGELEITGFSNYIHPMDSGHILAVGMEADTDGWTQNLQVSQFDVSDLENPVLDSRLQLDSYGSEAQYEHHAFNWFAPVETLLLPSGYGDESEMFLIHAAPGDELALKGSIDQDEVLYSAGSDNDYCTNFRRSVVIEEVAYGISNAGITVTDLDGEKLSYVAFDNVEHCANEYYYW
ncbi:MAG: hypothetical protein GY913_09210 [Proteobacteria bacterium]|nr:hypothetical protein [Pseudomonadota bacterium]